MQLDLTDDQALFHETTVRFVEAELPLVATRALHDDPQGYDRSWLAKAAQLGWFAMLVPEALGGGSVSEQGLLDLALVADVLGRHVQPGPFVPMNVVASAVAAHGSERLQREVLPGIVGGEVVAAWAFADGSGQADGGAGLEVVREGDGFRLTGTRGFVQDAVSADHLLVVGSLDGEEVQLLVPLDASGVSVRPMTALDLARRFALVELDGVTVPADAFLGGGAAGIEEQLLVAVALNLAETVGAMDALFDMTVTYAKDRIAFGRPIGSFQSIKHILADQSLYLETCKAVAVAAAKAVAGGASDAPEVVSMAAAYVGDQSRELAQECLQVHGGIGYTWEHDLHLLMRRIETNAVLYGEPSWHRERVCAIHELGASA
ncbi:MAG: acyl-CoA/acyl-ACP dehydrogenase [Actinomycetota bacterium]|nr:acyl-CoA/acyl-ACP dehydrogenase [Actinomycetota bacterium]